MAKKKTKKKGPAGKIAAGVLALALIGGAIGGDEPAENVADDPVSSSVSDVADPGKDNASETEEKQSEAADIGAEDQKTETSTPETEQAPPSAKEEPPAAQDPAPPAKEEPAKQETPVAQNPPAEVKKPEPAIDPEAAFREKLMQYNYVCSSESDKYHEPTCRWTSSINDSNLSHFDTEEEAVAAGYIPCGTCKP